MGKITRFERTRLITARALQISFGAPPLIKVIEGMSALNLAAAELEQGLLPLVVIRRFPDGRAERAEI